MNVKKLINDLQEILEQLQHGDAEEKELALNNLNDTIVELKKMKQPTHNKKG